MFFEIGRYISDSVWLEKQKEVDCSLSSVGEEEKNGVFYDQISVLETTCPEKIVEVASSFISPPSLAAMLTNMFECVLWF